VSVGGGTTNRRWTSSSRLVFLLTFLAVGCAATSPFPEGAFIEKPMATPQLPTPPAPAGLPSPPSTPASGSGAKPVVVVDEPDGVGQGPLALSDVLRSVEVHFPLLLAMELERTIAAGLRESAEGQFDPILRARASEQFGTFASGRLDVGVEQPLVSGGVNTFAGWRFGQGNFPIYYGDRKTGDGGEFRAGLTIPLLQNRDIDPRRARVRAAQIQERLADPSVRRARLDYLRSGAQAYWTWQAAGAQYQVAARLVELAARRQEVVDARQKGELISASAPALNRRLIASRTETRLAAERNLQQAAFRLSLFLRDGLGNPLVPTSEMLRVEFLSLEASPPDQARLPMDVATALARRPELDRFRLEKERRALELGLARNQLLPVANVVASAAQDVGAAEKTLTGTGPFDTDRTTAEVGATLEVPLPRRDARGRVRAAEAQLTQLLAQERYARDEITVQVQDAISELVQTFNRLAQAREELAQAKRVLAIESTLFENQQTTLFELNAQETAAAEAESKVAGILGMYFAAVANYQAALGID
jgi:cobalt-zinc-cadmium efflux system outer membrane protein